MNELNQEATPQRTATRAPVNRPVRLQFDDAVDTVEGHCVNVSIGGMFIQVPDSRPQGSLVRFELLLDEGHSIRGLGEVVWMRSQGGGPGREAGVGIKFRFLEQRDRQQIFKLVSQFIKERLSQRPSMTASPFPEAPEPIPDHGMIFRPPEDPPSSPSSPSSPSAPSASPFEGPYEASHELPHVPVSSEPPSVETPQPSFTPPAYEPPPYEPRRADSNLLDVEDLSGPLDLANEVEPWRQSAESAPAEDVDPSEGRAWSPTVETYGEAVDDGDDESSARRRAPVLALAALVLLALLAALAFFWGDLFGGDASEAPVTSDPSSVASGAGEEPVVGNVVGDPGADGSTAVLSSDAPPKAASSPPTSSRSPSSPSSPSPSPSNPPRSSPPPPTPSTAAAFDRLVDISWQAVSGGLEVIFTTNGSIPEKRWRHFRLGGDTPREVVRILGVSQGFGRNQIEVNGRGVRQIRIGYHRKPRGNELHVVMDLSSPQAKISEVRAVGSQLVVRVESP